MLIKGPISIYVGSDVNNTKYILFSDIHYQFSDIECKNCYNIIELLEVILKKYEEKNLKTNFYLESPYIFDKKIIPSKEEINKQISKIGFLRYILYKFYENFYSLQDSLQNNTTYHLIDFRLLYNDGNNEIDTINYTYSSLTIDGYIYRRINYILTNIDENTKININFIKITDILIKFFLENFKKEFEIRLFSHNLVNEIKTLYYPLLLQINSIDKYEAEKLNKILEYSFDILKNELSLLNIDILNKLIKFSKSEIENVYFNISKWNELFHLLLINDPNAKISGFKVLLDGKLIISSSILLDIYVITKFFSKRVNINILYAGYEHTDRVFRFLNNYLNIPLCKYNGNIPDQYVNVDIDIF